MKILIIEDDPKEAEVALSILAREGVELELVESFSEAFDKIWCHGKELRGVISDVFFPQGPPYGDDDPYGDKDLPDQARGLGIMALCQSLNLPCILCSSEFHHGRKLEWATQLLRQAGWPDIVDEKNWGVIPQKIRGKFNERSALKNGGWE